VKFFLSSRQHHSFSLSGTASRSSLGLEAFQSLKLIGMWSLTIHPDCLMNFLAAASGAIGSPSGPTSVIMNRPSSFFVGPRFVFFCCDDDPDGYKKNIHSIHIDSDENMIVTTNKYSFDMYISTLFSSSVILNRWCLNSITGHIQIYVGIAAIISLFSDISLTFANHIQQELFVFRVCVSRVHRN
jgi:hypothetical protein